MLLVVPANLPTEPATRSLKRSALLINPTCPCSPPALGPWMATCRPRQPQDARQNSRHTEMGKRAGRVAKRNSACMPGPARVSVISSPHPPNPV